MNKDCYINLNCDHKITGQDIFPLDNKLKCLKIHMYTYTHTEIRLQIDLYILRRLLSIYSFHFHFNLKVQVWSFHLGYQLRVGAKFQNTFSDSCASFREIKEPAIRMRLSASFVSNVCCSLWPHKQAAPF